MTTFFKVAWYALALIWFGLCAAAWWHSDDAAYAFLGCQLGCLAMARTT